MTEPSQYRLLVIDDEPDLRTLYELTLLREGYDIDTAGSVEEALELLAANRYSAVISDMRLPDGSGLEVLAHLEAEGRPEKTIVITAYGSAENAVEALKAGAFDYLTKPVDLKQFRAIVASAQGRGPATPPSFTPGSKPASAYSPTPSMAPPPSALASPTPSPKPAATPAPSAAWAQATSRAEAPSFKPGPSSMASASAGPNSSPSPSPIPALSPQGSAALWRMAGGSAAMVEVRQLVEKVARSMAPVLVHGESGTGKELVARAIHEVSQRASAPFIAVNCSAIPEHLLEAEFFGYRKGAFTGANEDREGFFQAASGGTLFLDEIGDLPLSMQSKLLRAIQERSVRAVGAVAEVAVNVRLLSATHKDLGFEVQHQRFRQDLYYRLNVIQIRVPPLRERLQDLPALCARVLDRIARDTGVSPPPRLTSAALAHLATYPFPGNVRELENLLQRAVALASQPDIGVDDLSLPMVAPTPASAPRPEPMAASAPGPEAPRSPPAELPFGFGVEAADDLPSNLERHLDAIERDILLRSLERHRYNRTAAGASLGLTLRQMRYRMARLGVMAGDDPAPAHPSS